MKCLEKFVSSSNVQGSPGSAASKQTKPCQVPGGAGTQQVIQNILKNKKHSGLPSKSTKFLPHNLVWFKNKNSLFTAQKMPITGNQLFNVNQGFAGLRDGSDWSAWKQDCPILIVFFFNVPHTCWKYIKVITKKYFKGENIWTSWMFLHKLCLQSTSIFSYASSCTLHPFELVTRLVGYSFELTLLRGLRACLTNSFHKKFLVHQIPKYELLIFFF